MGENMRVLRALGLSAVFFFLSIGAVSGSIDVYPVSGLERGAVGVGYTVVEETKIEPFIVEVLGVMERAGPAGSLILVRTSGELIDRVGGIASGMSGSPVYIDGKLLGAIGYGFQFADHRIGLVTPAADMLAVMELIEVKDEAPIGQELVGPAPTRLEPSGGERVRGAGGDRTGGVRLACRGASCGAPAGSVGCVAGCNAFDRRRARPAHDGPVGEDLRRVQCRADQGRATSGSRRGRGEAGAGSSFGSAARPRRCRCHGDRHGHRRRRGPVRRIWSPIPQPGRRRSLRDGRLHLSHGLVSQLSVQDRRALAPVGRLLQDRGAAIAGVMGEKPKTVSMSVEVSDRDRRVNEHFEVEIARDRELTVPLIIVSALEAVDRTLDRLGAGTSRVTFSIDGEGMPRELVRENVFYSGSDIAAASVSELLVGVDLLQGNEFQDPGITEVSVSIEVEAGEADRPHRAGGAPKKEGATG